MKKVLIIGCGGAGKSTLAKTLGSKLEMPVSHLDMHYWKSGWVETEHEEWREFVASLTSHETWIIDGNFGSCADLTYGSADTIIFLDRHPVVCLWRWFKRFLMYRKGGRPDITEGCHEKFDLEFLLWIWNFPKKSRPKIFERIAQYAQCTRFIHLTSDKEVVQFLNSLSLPPKL